MGSTPILLVREVFSMKSKRLLILLAPFTLGVNAETLSESVSVSTAGQKQEIIPSAGPQISSVQMSGINQSATREQLPGAATTKVTEVARKQASSENVMPVGQQQTEAHSSKVQSSVTESAEDWQLLPQTNEEADLVNKMFDKSEQNSIQANSNITPETASKVEVSTVTDGSSLHVAESAIPTKTATSATPTSTSQPIPKPVLSTDINESNTPTGSALQFVPTPLPDGSLGKQNTLKVPMPRFIPASVSDDSDKAVASTAFTSQSISKHMPSMDINKSDTPIDSALEFTPAPVPAATELVKENVSDYLVSQAQNKLNEANTQSEEKLKQDVQEIHENIKDINDDVASIRENLSLLTVAIAEKTGNIDAALLKSDDDKGSKKRKKTSSDTLSVVDEQEEITQQDNDDSGDAYDEYSENKSSKPIQEESGKKISHDLSEEKEDLKQHEKMLSNELEEETLSGELSKDRMLENDVDVETGVLSNRRQKDDTNGSEFSLILQELKKVNSKVNIIDDKVNDLSMKKTEIDETDKTITNEIKKKNN